MSAADIVSVVVAATAVGVAVFVVPLVALRRRSGHHAEGAGEASRDSHDGSLVSVQLAGSDDGWAWHFSGPGGSPTSIDIFSFRPTGDSFWRHELMSAPLPIVFGSASLPAAPTIQPGMTFDVAIGWTIAGIQGSDLLAVRAETD